MDVHQACQSNKLSTWFIDFIGQKQRFHGDFAVHEESQGAAFNYRVRFVWHETQTSQFLSFINLISNVSFCPVVRQNDLLGLEIASIHPFDFDKDKIDQLDQVEYFTLPKQVPNLSVPGLLLSDMDSTAIQIECIDELAMLAGVGDEVAEITDRAMQGELDFAQSLRRRVALLKGLELSCLTQLAENLPLMPGLEAAITELQQYGWRIALASGGFMPFVEALSQRFGLDGAYANLLEHDGERLTGNLVGSLVDAEKKADLLKVLETKFELPFSQLVAIGDGANDIPMLQQSAFGVGYHGKAKLIEHADIAINKLDLRALTFLLEKRDL